MSFLNVPLKTLNFNSPLEVSFFFFLNLGFIPGIDARFKSKSAYMKFNCESRIRGYMREVKFWDQTPCFHYQILTQTLGVNILQFRVSVSVFRWMKPPKPYRKQRSKQSSSRHQSACWRCWKRPSSMAATLTGLKGSRIVSAPGKDGLPARYDTDSSSSQNCTYRRFPRGDIKFKQRFTVVQSALNHDAFKAVLERRICFWSSSPPPHLPCLFRDHLMRNCASRSTPSTPTAAGRPGSSSAHGI